ncbi:hypothetical protein ACIQRE_01875 [Streptomyces griseoluteus]|uniref:hypothetical protein n=1 Tax=Streptomyces griseoluteus TaxID=29306 RepID=UPI0038120029
MTVLAPEAAADTTDIGEGLTHAVCECTPDVAYCGADVTGEPWEDDTEEVTCVVCRDLDGFDCPRCT